MIDARDPGQHRPAVRSDLVEYLIVSVADVDGLASVGAAIAELARADTVRVLDLVALVCDRSGATVVLEPSSVPELVALLGTGAEEGLLSERDIELAALALQPGTAAVVVVTEDRWAEPLSIAATAAGGQIVAGDRIPPRRVEAALAEQTDDGAGGR